MPTRIYVVYEGGRQHLLEAGSVAKIREFMTKNMQIQVADAKEVAELMAKGIKVEICDAGKE